MSCIDRRLRLYEEPCLPDKALFLLKERVDLFGKKPLTMTQRNRINGYMFLLPNILGFLVLYSYPGLLLIRNELRGMEWFWRF